MLPECPLGDMLWTQLNSESTVNLSKAAIRWGSGGDQPLGGAVVSLGKECACRADSGPGSVLDHYVTYRISVEGYTAYY